MKIRSRILLPLAPALLGLPGVVLAASPARDPRVEIVTDMGTIVVQLAPSRAPRTVENFLRYVREGHYAGTVFHLSPRDPGLHDPGRRLHRRDAAEARA